MTDPDEVSDILKQLHDLSLTTLLVNTKIYDVLMLLAHQDSNETTAAAAKRLYETHQSMTLADIWSME